jgi:hypothetical protein
MNSGVLSNLGNVTFSVSNLAMTCYQCAGTGTLTQSFTINFANSTASTNYNISFSNFNNKSGIISGSSPATAFGYDGVDMYLNMNNQTSTATGVVASSYINLYSVGIQNTTKRANLAQLTTNLLSGGQVMTGYTKILGR